jgi:tetratricopeptide (TPR) repeat protein
MKTINTILICLCLFSVRGYGEKVLMYDEEKGIVFVDKNEIGAQAEKAKPKEKKERGEPRQSMASVALPQPLDTSLIRGKKKDSSGVYFSSGLQFFKAGDYEDALRLFIYADSTDPRPVYSLWIGKTYRQLGKGEQQLVVMKKILLSYPDSDVADDALFEIAFYYQTQDNYQKAAETYTKLSEQYPFGKSYSNGEDFRDVAKRQKQMMRSEIVTTLKLLGYDGDEAEDLCKDFQEKNQIPATGQPDKQTIMAIKQAYREYLVTDEKKAQDKQALARHMRMSIGCIALFGVCLISLVFVRMQAAHKKKHLLELSQSINDIDIRKL